MQKMNGRKWVLPGLLAAMMLILVAAKVSAEDAGPWPIAWRIAEAGRVSLAVYDAEGRLLREVLRGVPHEAGEHVSMWDGLAQDGTPVAPGAYTWRLLRTPGFKAEYVTSLGIRPGTAPYDSWVGNHAGPASVAVDETGVYIAAQITETAVVILKQSLDGKERLWSRGRSEVTDGRFQGGVSVATDGLGQVYMLQQNGLVQVLDAGTGELRVDLIGRDAYMGALGASARFGRDRPERRWDPLPAEVQAGIKERHEVRFLYRHRENEIGGADLAAAGATIVISFRDQNTVRWLSPVDGSTVHAVTVPAPLGVTVAPDGRVYVISAKSVLAVAPDGGTRVIVKDLVNPVRLAFDRANDELLVVESAPDFRIKRYTLEGALKGAYGRLGGRQDGAYVPEDFLGVTSIAADGLGGFFVTEETTAPRRVAHVDGAGELVAEWYGGQPYYAWGEPDPRDPTKVWFNPGAWLTLAEIDYDSGEWRVLENYRQASLGGGLVRPMSGHTGRWRVLYHEDNRYLVSEGVPQVLRHEPSSLRAVSVLGGQAQVEAAATLAGYEGEAKAFRWLDVNGDGIPQPEEISFSSTGPAPVGRAVAESFDIIGVESRRQEDQSHFVVTTTQPSWSAHGPIYPFGEEAGVNSVAAQTEVPSGVTTGGTRGVGVFRDRDGNYYGHYNTGDDRHGTTWPTEWGAQSRLVKWHADGSLAWRVGRHAIHGGLGREPHTTPPGYIHVGAAIIGELRDTIIMADRVENMGMVWTKDGLYAGNLLDGRVDDGLPDTVYYWWRTPGGEEAIVTSDNATGGAIVEGADGEVIFFTQGRNSVPTYKIHGWDGWTREQGSIAVGATPAHAARQGSGLNAAYYAQPDFAGEPVVTRVDERVWHGIPRRKPGSNEIIDGFGGGPSYDWSGGIEPLDLAPGEGFAVRFSGAIEVPLSESFTFSVYARGQATLWLDGAEVPFVRQDGQRWETAPITLRAGQRLPVRLDFTTRHQHPSVSLNWESPTLDRQRIPSAYLYP